MLKKSKKKKSLKHIATFLLGLAAVIQAIANLIQALK